MEAQYTGHDKKKKSKNIINRYKMATGTADYIGQYSAIIYFFLVRNASNQRHT